MRYGSLNPSERNAVRWFTATIFVAAFLLFFAQPMYGKRLLPSLGGSPAVWNTVMVFFQAALLGGYLYAHRLAKRVGFARWHLIAMAVAASVPVLFLPDDPPPVGVVAATAWLLRTLSIGIGLPFVLLAATSPMLGAWFANLNHPMRRDPYFLYSASNFGSFCSLIAYPLLIEPTMALGIQSWVWRAGFVTLIFMILRCKRLVDDSPTVDVDENGGDAKPAADSMGETNSDALDADRIDRGRITRWVLTSAVASSWLLGVTQYLTTDLAPVPLLWVVPLAIYLLSFVVAFAGRRWIETRTWESWLPPLLLLMVASVMFYATWPPLVIHLATFTIGVMICHHRLADDRPRPRFLTAFYLWISLGGVLGGIFNAIVAPLTMPVILEYGIAFVGCGVLMRWSASRERLPDPAVGTRSSDKALNQRSTWILLASVGAVIAWMVFTMLQRGTPSLAYGILLAAACILTFWLLDLRWLCPIAAGILLVHSQFEPPFAGDVLAVRRSFFGVHRVLYAPLLKRNRLVHGQTVHGIQAVDHPERPLAYYSRQGPLGYVLEQLAPSGRGRRIAVIGLGTGAIAAYRNDFEPPRQIKFFEIDPAVIDLAVRDTYFSYLSDAAIGRDDIVVGDGRQQLDRYDGPPFDTIVLDAFSSDAVPMHLLTREALQIYADHLTDNGLILFHISNQHLDLAPVLGGLADDAGWTAYGVHFNPALDQFGEGVAPSDWVVIGRRPETIPLGVRQTPWRRIDSPSQPRWTDEHGNFLDVLRWGRES